MQIRFYLLFILLLSFLPSLFSQSYNAEKIEPTLLGEAQAEPKDFRSVVLLLEDQVDALGMEQLMLKENLSLHERRVRLVRTLEKKAQTTQKPLLTALQKVKGIEKGSITSYWITNAIELRANFGAIAELSHWEDLEIIEGVYPAKLFDAEQEATFAPPTPNSAEPGLKDINADKMWALGYTGYGTKVFVLDSGQFPDHVALRTNFLGNNVPVRQAWSGTNIPETCDDHGTHVAGIIVGIDRVTNDTLGVAPNAKWIGGAVPLAECNLTQNIRSSIGNMQWALNPDGNSSTTNDIPDVINNSWGNTVADCLTVLRNVSNSLEAAGVAVVWAAGNEGPSANTVFGHQSLNTSLVNTFTVGNIDGNSNRIAASSSRGPSYCEGTGSLLIKPEVVAPGQRIRSTQADGDYGSISGTSFAAPHVAGAILLLKEAFPELPGSDLKLALYRSARDLGEEGEDNNYGMGLIDVFAAYEFLIDQGFTPTPPLSALDDVTLVDVQTARSVFCRGGVDVNVVFENVTDSDLSSLQIDYFITGEASRVDRVEWMGNLGKNETTTFALPTIEDLPVGNYNLIVDIFAPDGRNDLRPLNNRLRHTFQIADLEYVNASISADYTETICRDAEVVLESNFVPNPQGTQRVRWYSTDDGRDFIGEGNRVLTPPLTESTTFFADIVTVNNTGKANIAEGERTSFSVDKGGLAFDAHQSFILRSVKVVAEEKGTRIIRLADLQGNLIKQRVINIPEGESSLELNFEVPQGDGLTLELGAGKPLIHSNSNVSYPYEIPETVTITRSEPTSSFRYYFFYDWEIESDLVCGRTAVTVDVNDNTSAEPVFFSISADTVSLSGDPTVNFTNETNGIAGQIWDFGDGARSSEANPSHTYDAIGTYKVILTVTTTDGCVNSAEKFIHVRTVSSTPRVETLEEAVLVYPNPTNEFLFVETEKVGTMNIQLLDMLGRRVQQYNEVRSSFQMNVANLPSGIYYVWLEKGGKYWIEKVIKE
ncbi:MAG: S8 family serine peptidase [Bacteroidota bacterium]